jgi:hypothetical protein
VSARAGALGSVGERQKKMNRAHLQLEASKPAPQTVKQPVKLPKTKLH